MADLPHQTIGRYQIREEIGRGMMGVVYEAVDPALARTIALKTIKLSFSVEAEDLDMFEERFFAEARIAARLSHPGIVVVHDVGRDPQTGTLYIAMERLRGRTLADLIREGVGLEWRAALFVVVRIAEALHHAHSEGVIHRDLKPANIMLLPSGEPKILDFGIAKVETARTKLTTDGQFFGTPLYMSPEQAQGKDLDARSDLFSLGALAYNLLTGHAAFAADSVPAIMRRVVEDEPFPPSHFVPDLPAGVDAVLGRALAKEPAHRYPDGQSLAEDLKEILGGRAPDEALVAYAPSHLVQGMASDLQPDRAGPELPRTHPVGVATRPGGDLEEELETLVSGLIPLDASGPLPAAPPLPSASPGPVASTSRRVGLALLSLAAGVGLVGLGAAAYLAGSRLLSTTPAGMVASPKPPLAPAPGVATPPASSSVTAVSPSQAAALTVDFEHPLREGQLSVWIDGKLAVDEDLAGRIAKKLVAIKVHQGSIAKTLAVAPGRREVRVRVAWEDNVKEETLAATFRPGSTRRLEIRLGRIRKNLSVEWK